MKTKILLSFIFYFSLLKYSHAQHDYVPMAVEGAQWVYYQDDDDNFPPFDDYFYGFRIEGDTLINGTAYKKVYYRHFEPVENEGGPAYAPVYLSGEYLFGAIRDDIPNKKVYGIVFENDYWEGCNIFDEEFLMYDFDKQLGDDFNEICLVEGDAPLDQIIIENIFGADRLLYKITPPGSEWAYQLEGVGNYSPGGSGLFIFNLFSPMYIPLGCPCTGLVIYCVGSDQTCLNGFLIGIDEENLKSKIEIFPNPVSDQLLIKKDISIHLNKIELYNPLGERLITQNEVNALDMSQLNSGIYTLVLNTNKGIFYKKIIKKTSM